MGRLYLIALPIKSLQQVRVGMGSRGRRPFAEKAALAISQKSKMSEVKRSCLDKSYKRWDLSTTIKLRSTATGDTSVTTVVTGEHFRTVRQMMKRL